MIREVLDWFQRGLEAPAADDGHDLALATAALLMEVSRADRDKGAAERDTMLRLLTRTFEFTPEEIRNLVTIADETSDASVDLYSFTSVVNRHYNYDDKVRLVRMLWDVAWADGRVAAIEDHIVRRIAGLLHVSHPDFIMTRNAARDARTAGDGA